MTIDFRHVPPPAPDHPHLPLVRVPAAGNWLIALTCWELLQTGTHFVGRRTVPHLKERCPGCKVGKPVRYEAYASGVRSSDKKHLIIALTPTAARDLFEALPNPNQLRGHIVTFTRHGKQSNGTLRITTEGSMLSHDRLPPAPDLLAHMLDIWGLDASHLGTDHQGYAHDVARELDPTSTPDAS